MRMNLNRAGTMRLLAMAACLGIAACAARASEETARVTSPSAEGEGVGILLMAHGGSAEWNESVSGAVASLRERMPVTVAFGMADPKTLEAALDTLADGGVERVAVVRLFISGESFLDQTLYLLGLREAPPAQFVVHGGQHGSSGGGQAPIAHDLEVITHEEGLARWSGVARILMDRAGSLSRDVSRESVLIVAHGMATDEDNGALLAAMEAAAEGLRKEGYFSVAVETLREDWPEERAAAEVRIRSRVEQESAAGRLVLVVPLRLSGFGPYETVLEGLSYARGQALLPHAGITAWIEETAAKLFCREGWSNPLRSCR